MTRAEILRAICCDNVCSVPHACRMHDTTRAHLVDIHHAARAVQALLVKAWRDYPKNDGPMVRSRTYGEEG